jgi:hypothetical protein
MTYSHGWFFMTIVSTLSSFLPNKIKYNILIKYKKKRFNFKYLFISFFFYLAGKRR